MKIIVILIAVALTGCAATGEYPSRRPCGNVWNVCYGDNKFIDKITDITEGRQ